MGPKAGIERIEQKENDMKDARYRFKKSTMLQDLFERWPSREGLSDFLRRASVETVDPAIKLDNPICEEALNNTPEILQLAKEYDYDIVEPVEEEPESDDQGEMKENTIKADTGPYTAVDTPKLGPTVFGVLLFSRRVSAA